MLEQPPKFICELCGGMHPTIKHGPQVPDQKLIKDLLAQFQAEKPDLAARIIERVGVSVETVMTPEVIGAISELLRYSFSNGAPYVAEECIALFPVAQDIVDKSLVNGLREAIIEDRWDQVDVVMREYPVPEAVLRTPELQDAVRTALPNIKSATIRQHIRKSFFLKPE